MNERRVSELEDILIRARLIDETKISKDEALLSATVTVRDLGSGEEFDYMLVSEEESDYDMDKISITSPVGEAILGHKVGDIVEIQIPAGILKYEIMKIS